MIAIALAACVWHGSQTLPCLYFAAHRTLTCQITKTRRGSVLICIPSRQGPIGHA